MKIDTNIHIKKSTHGGRPFAVEQAAKWGAPMESRMALGGWMNSNAGSFKPCYDRSLPTDAMLGAAGFNAQKQTSYFVSRDVLGTLSTHVVRKHLLTPTRSTIRYDFVSISLGGGRTERTGAAHSRAWKKRTGQCTEVVLVSFNFSSTSSPSRRCRLIHVVPQESFVLLCATQHSDVPSLRPKFGQHYSARRS